MNIQSLFKMDNYTKLLKYSARLKELYNIENVRAMYYDVEFQNRERWMQQALALYDKNTHQYYGNPDTDVYNDCGATITGLDNMISNVEKFLDDCKQYVPGGPITTE